MMALVSTTKFRGKHKNSFCKWLQLQRKIHIIEGNDEGDWDNGELINGHNKLQFIHRRPGILNIRKNWISYWFCMFSTHCKHIFLKK
jgi:hypothetical protein